MSWCNYTPQVIPASWRTSGTLVAKAHPFCHSGIQLVCNDGPCYLDSVLLAAPILLALACSQGPADPERATTPAAIPSPVEAQPTAQATAAVPQLSPEVRSRRLPLTPIGPPPKVDTSILSVPLEDIWFDTFDGGFLRLSQADDRSIEALRDRIRPIYEPRYDDVDGGAWLRGEDRVIGYVAEGGAAFAYPL